MKKIFAIAMAALITSCASKEKFSADALTCEEYPESIAMELRITESSAGTGRTKPPSMIIFDQNGIAVHSLKKPFAIDYSDLATSTPRPGILQMKNEEALITISDIDAKCIRWLQRKGVI